MTLRTERQLWCSGQSTRVPGCQKLQMTAGLNPVWHRMLYSCTRMAPVGIKGLIYYTGCAVVGTVTVLTASVPECSTAPVKPSSTAFMSVVWPTPASGTDFELPSISRDEHEAPSDAVISSFFSTMIELVSVDDENTGLSGRPALVNGWGMSLCVTKEQNTSRHKRRLQRKNI